MLSAPGADLHLLPEGRIVHALHATLLQLRASVWFDYVRSKANVSDEPSREPSLESAYMRVGGRECSEPRVLLLPEAQAWDSEAYGGCRVGSSSGPAAVSRIVGA